MRELGTQSTLAVPLVARGQLLGTITLNSARPHRYGSTERELGQELARRAAIAIDNARLHRETERQVRLRDEFLSCASHELRTPLTSLQLVVQRVTHPRARCSPETTARALVVVEQQVRRLTRLVDELLEVTELQARPYDFHLAPIDLSEVGREVARRFGTEIARAGCSLAIDADRPVVGQWDRHRLERLVTHLLSNAVKFGAGKPIEIAVREMPRGTGRLVITDHGIGIPAERLPHIFERYERGVSARNYGGLGLGLFIVRSIVEGLGGAVRVESAPSVGSTVTVELPSGTPSGVGARCVSHAGACAALDSPGHARHAAAPRHRRRRGRRRRDLRALRTGYALHVRDDAPDG